VRVPAGQSPTLTLCCSMDKLAKQLDLLHQRFSRESNVMPNVLLMYWPADEGATDETIAQQCQPIHDCAAAFVASSEIVLRPHLVDYDFVSLVPSLVKTRVKNSNRVPPVTLACRLAPNLQAHLTPKQPACSLFWRRGTRPCPR
jgi:hypothetical protein